MENFKFDDSNIQWHKLGDFEHILYSVLNIDEVNTIIDVMFKLEAQKPIVLHRHKALNTSFVIQGEHYLYQSDGELKEIRSVGSFTISPASDEPHTECGGDEGAVVLFSIRGCEGVLYEILDEDFNNIATLTFQDFIDMYQQQESFGKN
ncbi:MAG: regulator [Methylococcaceae bacterium]|nr:regulator [Methylococcaceae bacterium]